MPEPISTKISPPTTPSGPGRGAPRVDLAEVRLDGAVPLEKRGAWFRQTFPQGCFRVGELEVTLEFSPSGPPLEDLLAELLIREKGG